MAKRRPGRNTNAKDEIKLKAEEIANKKYKQGYDSGFNDGYGNGYKHGWQFALAVFKQVAAKATQINESWLPYEDIIILTSRDLLHESRNKSIIEVGLMTDFKISAKRIEQADLIIYVQGEKARVLKSRY